MTYKCIQRKQEISIPRTYWGQHGVGVGVGGDMTANNRENAGSTQWLIEISDQRGLSTSSE